MPEGEVSSTSATPGDAAPTEDDDEEVVIEELPPGGAPGPEAGGAAAAAASPAEGAGGAEAEEAADGAEESDVDLPEDASPHDIAVAKIEKMKKKMSAVERLEAAICYKCEGNEFFKKNEIFKAADAYYHCILFCREVTNNPQYYPKLGHTPQQRKMAQDLCESVYTNLALVQTKYAATLPENHAELPKVLEEAERSASEALKLNPKNVKALYRRAAVRVLQAKGAPNAEAQRILTEAKADLQVVLAEDPQNRPAHAEARSVQERLKVLKKEEIATERKVFAFGSSLSGMSAKEKDLLSDGTVLKRQESAGDGGRWMNEDWLAPDAPIKCVVYAKVAMLSSGGAAGTDKKHSTAGAPVSISFILGDEDMHEGLQVAVRSMSLHEVANFTLAPSRLRAGGGLVALLPEPQGQPSVWQVTLDNFITWTDLDRNGQCLQKIKDEGWGRFPEPLSEVAVHWRVLGPDGSTVHSSRWTIDLGSGGGGLKHVEDEDKEAQCFVLGENCWEPLAILCRSLRQGGVGELRMKRLPPLPKDTSGDSTASATAQLSMMMNKFKAKSGKEEEDLRHCTIRAELERVVLPIVGPEDARWEGVSAIVEERFRAEQLLERGADAAALVRLRRVVDWVSKLPAADATAATASEGAAAKASIGWVLACRAAPILDAGNVTSELLAAARKELEEAEEHCAWLEEKHPQMPGTQLLRAKILVAQDDDFAGAHVHLLEAQRSAPNDKRVQEELKTVKIELRKAQEEESRAKVVVLRDSLKRAREESSDTKRADAVVDLLQQLDGTRVSWDTVMETKIGVELKHCQDGCGDEAKRLCVQILGRLKDESKEQRPMWDS